jgi:sucrose-6-phosphate hydrolase SacC (GH32 family)
MLLSRTHLTLLYFIFYFSWNPLKYSVQWDKFQEVQHGKKLYEQKTNVQAYHFRIIILSIFSILEYKQFPFITQFNPNSNTVLYELSIIPIKAGIVLIQAPIKIGYNI